MKLRLLPIFLAGSLIAACGGPAPNTVINSADANNPLQTNSAPPDPNINTAPTLTPVFKSYCEAMIKKDEAALRRIYSTDTIKNFEKQMKADKIKTLTQFLSDDTVTDKLCDIKNERIDGDRAIATMSTDAYPKGIEIVFTREGGEWKLTNQAPTLSSVKPSSNSNAVTPANTGSKSNAVKK